MTSITNAAAAAALDTIVDLVDVGAGSFGTVEIRDSGDTVLVTFDLQEPAFGNATVASPSVATAAGLPLSAVASATGTADDAVIKDEDGNVIFDDLTVGVEVTVSPSSITTSQTVNLTGCQVSLATTDA